MRARIESRRQATPPPTTPPLQQLPSAQPTQSRSARPSDPRLSASPPSLLAKPRGAKSAGQGRADGQSDSEGSPTFGIDVTPVQVGSYAGLQVLGFRPDSQAASAGLRMGDVIVSIGGVRTGALADVASAQESLRAGQQADMQVIRGGRMYRMQVPVVGPGSNRADSVDTDDQVASSRGSGQRAATDSDATKPRAVAKPPINSATGPTLARPRSSLGLEVRNASPKRGVEVVTVRESTAGEVGGLKPQDRIVSVEGRLVKDIDGLIRELAVSQPGDEVQFGVVRGESMLELKIEMGGPGGKPLQSATASQAKSRETSAKPKDSDSGPSLLSGMGSALGSFFAGEKSKEDAKLPPPSDDPSSPTDDPLALPEDDSASATKSRVDFLPPPQAVSEPVTSNEGVSEVDQLRAEVKRLKAELSGASK